MSHDSSSSSSPRITLQDLLYASEGNSELLDPSIDLDQLRRSIDIRIDAEGRWWHEGILFTHPRLITYFNRQIGWLQGEATLTIGHRWCYIGCEITPFLILKLELDRQQPWAVLNTEERYPLQNLTLIDDLLFAQLNVDRFARMSRHAQSQCAHWLREAHAHEADADSGFVLEIEGKIWPIRLKSKLDHA